MQSQWRISQLLLEDGYKKVFQSKGVDKDGKEIKDSLSYKSREATGRMMIQAAEALKAFEEFVQRSGDKGEQIVVKLPEDLVDDYGDSNNIAGLPPDTVSIADAQERGEVHRNNGGNS